MHNSGIKTKYPPDLRQLLGPADSWRSVVENELDSEEFSLRKILEGDFSSSRFNLMHELPVIEKITRIAISHAGTNLAKKVVRIRIRVGELSDLSGEWMQRYFDFVSKGTIAEGAVLEIEWTPVMFRCDECAKAFPVKIREAKDVFCPSCASGKVTFLSGREYFIKEMEVI